MIATGLAVAVVAVVTGCSWAKAIALMAISVKVIMLFMVILLIDLRIMDTDL